MRRDWQLIRYILVAVEALDHAREENAAVWPNSFEGYGTGEVSYHMRILQEAGLIEATCRSGTSEPFCLATSLTWQGHELLELLRSDQMWERIQTVLAQRGLGTSFRTINRVADELIGHPEG